MNRFIEIISLCMIILLPVITIMVLCNHPNIDNNNDEIIECTKAANGNIELFDKCVEKLE